MRHIVREYKPRGMPLLIQGEVRKVPSETFIEVDMKSLRAYPILGDKILPAADFLLEDEEAKLMIAQRLVSIVKLENFEEND
tara:strand:- start:3106 stop:3351 length:246 start_codon:yes stop_codon:yes gene_type:complete